MSRRQRGGNAATARAKRGLREPCTWPRIWDPRTWFGIRRMKFFIDIADVGEIRKLAATGGKPKVAE